MILNYWRWEGT